MKRAKKYIALLLAVAMVGSSFTVVQASGFDGSEAAVESSAQADLTEESTVSSSESAEDNSNSNSVVQDITTAISEEQESETPVSEENQAPVDADNNEDTTEEQEEAPKAALASVEEEVTEKDDEAGIDALAETENSLVYFNANIFDYKEGTKNTTNDAVNHYGALSGATYLDDMTLTSTSSGWGNIGIGKCGACLKDGTDNVGISVVPDKNNKNFVVTYDKGITMHANGSATVAVPSDATNFTAIAALNGCMITRTVAMKFTVTVTGGSNAGTYEYTIGTEDANGVLAKVVDINVTGATSLKLDVIYTGTNNGGHHAVWADAKFTTTKVDQSARMGQKGTENQDGAKSINDYTYEKNSDTSKGLYFTAGTNNGAYTISGNQNSWTGEKGGVITGIAKNELNGSDIEFDYTEPGLFTLEANSAKDVFTNVQFPFVMDSNGYYTFDSTQMDAAFEDGKGVNGAKLKWYDGSAKYSKVSQTNGDKTGFFPFNDTKGAETYTENLNYWFGMSMAVDFYMLNGGYMDTAKKEPITFEFSGDDDVWVYIDGKLVMDLGGIHDMASGSINFGTNTITVTPADGTTTTTSVSNILGNEWVNDDGIHSLQVFYLERGKGASNLKIKFNLPQKDQLVVEKMYDNTSATGTDAAELLEKEFSFQVKQDGQAYANAKYALFENGAMIGKNLLTDDDGVLTLKYGQRAVFSLEMPRPDEHTYQVEEIFSESGFTTTWEITKNNATPVDGNGTVADNTVIGAKNEYLRTNVDIYTYTFHNYRNTTLSDDTVVIDYGKEIDVKVFANDKVYASRTINLSDSTNTNGTFSGKGEMVAYTPGKFMNAVETTKYNVTDAQGNNQSATVTVIPATTVYYEDDFPGITFSEGWSIATSESTSKGKVQDDGTVGTNRNYGYDSTYDGDLYYSGGSSHYIEGKGKDTSASFTFTGTGFDIISRTDNKTGVIRVVAKDTDGNQKFAQIVDTVYQTEGETLYQIPVINCSELDYGEYTVTITVLGETASSAGNTRFYLDAIRIYNPLGSNNSVANAAYTADKEKELYTKEIRNLLISQDALSSVDEGFVYVDKTDYVDSISKYTSEGPNNEVYLKYQDAVCTTLTTSDGEAPDSVQIGAKAPAGVAYMQISIVNGYTENPDGTYELDWDYLDDIRVATATDMYYDITKLFTRNQNTLNWNKGVTLAIAFETTDESYEEKNEILSLTYLKTTGMAVNCLANTSNNQTLMAVQDMKVNNAGEQDTLKIYGAESDKTTYSRSKNMVFTVVTSGDVTGIQVEKNGSAQKILKTTSSENSDGTITWTLTTRSPSKSGTYSYDVYAVNADGQKSEAAIISISTK